MHALGLPSARRPNACSSTSTFRSSNYTADGETIRSHKRALPERRERRLRLGLLGLWEHLLLLLLLWLRLLCHLGLHLVSQKASKERDALLDIRACISCAFGVALGMWEAQCADASSTPVLSREVIKESVQRKVGRSNVTKGG